MAKPGSRTPPEGRFRDKAPEEYRHPDLNPYLRLHREFGPPVLTASQALEAAGRWDEVFGRAAPLHLEIGSGNGFFLTELARRHPEWNVLGIEIRFKRVVLTARKLVRAGVAEHARIARYDARQVDDLFRPGELARVYLNHPDPWPKKRQAHHRLLGPEWVARLARLMAPGAELRVKTDHLVNVEGLLAAIEGTDLELVGRSDDVRRLGAPWPDDIRTNYQRKFDERGLPVYALRLRRTTSTRSESRSGPVRKNQSADADCTR